MKARKKPVEVEVMLFIGLNWEECLQFMGEEPSVSPSRSDRRLTLEIETLEGTMVASVGDYIIKGVQGEFYPCKPDIFHQTYEITN